MSYAPKNPACLHCCIMAAIDDFYSRQPRAAGGRLVYSAPDILSALAENAASLIVSAPSRPERRRSAKFAHDALDAAITAEITGRRQVVVADPLATEH